MNVDLLQDREFDTQVALGNSRLVFHHKGQHPVTISIVIPTYNRDVLLAQAFFSALNQIDFNAYEIIIIDNNPDSAAALLQQIQTTTDTPTIKYYVNRNNLGMFGNWNRGIELAEGIWVTLLHDDDWLYPEFLKTISLFATDDNDVLACGSAIGEDDYAGRRVSAPRGGRILANQVSINRLILGNLSPAPGILIKKSLLIEVGGFDANYYPCADYFTYVRCALKGKSLIIRNTLAYYRTSDSQTFKDDTLTRMVTMSARIKSELMLLSKRKWASKLYYILSMATWYRLSREKASKIVLPERTALNTYAELLSKSGVLLTAVLKANSLYSKICSREFLLPK